MKLLITSVILSIFLQICLSRSDSLNNRLQLRDTSTGQDQEEPQTCKVPNDNNEKTNLFNCLGEDGPVDLNECQVAAQAMMEQKKTDMGYGHCGVIFYKLKKNGLGKRVHPDSRVTLAHVQNSLNVFPDTCCIEKRPEVGHPTLSDLGPIPEGVYHFASGLLRRNYASASRLDEDDFQALVKANSKPQ